MQTLSELLTGMTKERRLIIRTPKAYSWGNIDQCRDGFIRLFKELDKTIVEYKHLPEYDEVIEWMVDTQGKGLLLHHLRQRWIKRKRVLFRTEQVPFSLMLLPL